MLAIIDFDYNGRFDSPLGVTDDDLSSACPMASAPASKCGTLSLAHFN